MSGMTLTRLVNVSFTLYVRQELSREVVGIAARTEDNRIYTFPHRPFVGTKPISLYVNGLPIVYEKVIGTGWDDEHGTSAILETNAGIIHVYPDAGVVMFEKERAASNVITGDFSYTFVGVPGTGSISESLRPPIVAIDSDRDDQLPMELGSASSVVETMYHVNIYGNSPGQRDDLTDRFVDVLKKPCPIWNLNDGFPLGIYSGAEGSFDPNNIVGIMYFDRVSVRRNPLKSNDDIEMGRSLVSFIGTYVRA